MTAWWIGVAIAATCLFGQLLRGGPVALATRTPFDNTRSGHAEQWAFLSAAAARVPAIPSKG